jgi:hypothetical protein
MEAIGMQYDQDGTAQMKMDREYRPAREDDAYSWLH